VLESAVARPRRLVLSYGLGGQDGVGGILLGLALVQRITRTADARWESAFGGLLHAVTDDDVDRADPLDLLAGLRGFTAGLTAGAQLGWRVDAAPARRARRRLVDAVAAHLTAVESGTAAPRNGFSHGDAGVAAVLSALCGLLPTFVANVFDHRNRPVFEARD